MKLTGKSTFIPAPEGVHNAVCIDVVELGLVDGKFGPREMLRIVWELEVAMDNGKPFLAANRYFASIGKKANLRKVLISWRGRDFTEEELNEFETDNLIGAPCQLVIQHNVKDGTTYANIEAVLKAGAKKLAPSGGYKRWKDREENKEELAKIAAQRATKAEEINKHQEQFHPPEQPDESCPF